VEKPTEEYCFTLLRMKVVSFNPFLPPSHPLGLSFPISGGSPSHFLNQPSLNIINPATAFSTRASLRAEAYRIRLSVLFVHFVLGLDSSFLIDFFFILSVTLRSGKCNLTALLPSFSPLVHSYPVLIASSLIFSPHLTHPTSSMQNSSLSPPLTSRLKPLYSGVSFFQRYFFHLTTPCTVHFPPRKITFLPPLL